MAIEPFHDTGSVMAPARQGVAVTPSDTTNLGSTRALWVGTGGDLSVRFTNDSSAVTIANVADGTLLPFRVARVMAATTADDIVALY